MISNFVIFFLNVIYAVAAVVVDVAEDEDVLATAFAWAPKSFFLLFRAQKKNVEFRTDFSNFCDRRKQNSNFFFTRISFFNLFFSTSGGGAPGDIARENPGAACRVLLANLKLNF